MHGCATATVLATIAIGIVYFGSAGQTQNEHSQVSGEWFDQLASGLPVLEEGKQIFRFDTFGDEAFWANPQASSAIEGTKSGGVGAGVSPNTGLAVGLKVDMDVVPAKLVEKIKKGQVNLTDGRTTRSVVAHDRLLLQN